MRELLKYLWRLGLLHRFSQDFSNEWWEGGSHCVEQRALQCLPPEYCRSFAKKKAYKGRGTPQDPHPLAMRMLQQCNHAKILTEWQSRGDTCKLKHSEEYLITCLRWTCHIHNDQIGQCCPWQMHIDCCGYHGSDFMTLSHKAEL